jgi:hypothetical protein
MINMSKDNTKGEDSAPVPPMTTAAAFALARNDKDGEKIAAVFRQAIEPRTAIASP